MDNGERASLATLCAGDAIARFDDELEKAIKNVMDSNTDAEAKREVKLTLVLKPNKGRDVVTTVVKIESRLAAPKPEPTMLFVGLKRNGEVVATEHNPKQPPLFEDEPVSPPRMVKGDD